MMNCKLILFFVVILFSNIAIAQENCQDDIDKANKLFEDGIFREAEEVAVKVYESCELNKTQENEILKLIASIYYELDELEKGFEYIAKFVKKNPYYIPSRKKDPFHFREGIKRVKAWPQFTVALRGGYPMGWVATNKIYPILDTADYTQAYKINPVFSGNIEFGWNINMFVSLSTGFGIRMQELTHEVPQYGQVTFNYKETMMNYCLPVTVHLNLPISSRVTAGIFVGAEFEYLGDSRYSYSYETSSATDDRYSIYSFRKRDEVDVDDSYRNDLRIGAVGGIRVLYKLEQFAFFADVRYINEFNLYNNPDTRFDDLDLSLSNNYSMADIEFETLNFSVGFLYNFGYRVKLKY